MGVFKKDCLRTVLFSFCTLLIHYQGIVELAHPSTSDSILYRWFIDAHVSFGSYVKVATLIVLKCNRQAKWRFFMMKTRYVRASLLPDAAAANALVTATTTEEV